MTEYKTFFHMPVGVERRVVDKKNNRVGILPEYDVMPEGMRPIDFTIHTMEQRAPDLLRMTYPRIYERTDRWHSPKEVGAMFALSLFVPRALGWQFTPTTYRLLSASMKPLIERRMPLMFVAPDLLQAVLSTDFHDPIDWTTMKLPYEEGVFVFPRGTIAHETDGDVGFIAYGRQRAGVPYTFPIELPNGEHHLDIGPSDRFVFAAACPHSKNLVWYDSNLTAAERPVIEYNNIYWDGKGDDWKQHERHGRWDLPLDRTDAGFLELCGRVLFGLLLALTARPDLMGKAERLRAVPAKKDRPAREFWSPNVIGANYRPRVVPGAPGGGTGIKQREHWRRGHWKNQPYGPNHSLRRPKWIEPYWVSGEVAS